MSDTDTVSWYVTFGFGGEWGGHYSEIQVPACYSIANQEAYCRQATFERYGRAWAFNYPPEAFDRSIARYGMALREVVTA